MASRFEEMRQARSESLAQRPAVASGVNTQARAGGGRNDGYRTLGGAGRIRLDRIMADPGQPRKTFGTEADDRLAISMKAQGQLVPVLVRWDVEADRYVVIDGERRYRAATAAGLPDLKVVVEDEADPDTILELQLVTNALREEVAPVEQARAYQRLIDARGLTRRQLGEKLAIDQSAITKALALLDLPTEVQNRVDAGELPASTAAQIARLDNPADQREMAVRAIAEGLSRAEVAVEVERSRPRKPSPAKAKGGGAKSKLATSRRFRFPGGLLIEATRAKGLDPLAMIEAFRSVTAELEGEVRASVGSPGDT